MLSTTRRRALAALAATALAAGLAVAGAAPAQALPGSAVALVNLTGTFATVGGSRQLDLSADLTVADTANPGTIVFTIETITACGVVPTTSTLTLSNIDHNGIYVFAVGVPANGVVRVSAAMSDGAGGETPLAGLYPFWEVSAIPGSLTTTFTPSATTAGTGTITFSTGTELAGYPLTIHIDGAQVASTDVGYCETDTFGYSGFAVGQTIEIFSIVTGSTVLASYTIPDLPTQAIDPAADPAAAAGPTLAATGVDALPYLAISALLLAAGAAAVLMARRRRFAD